MSVPRENKRGGRMSASDEKVVPLRERILGVLQEKTVVWAKEFLRLLPDVDRTALDCGLNALQRDGQIELHANQYRLLSGKPDTEHKPTVDPDPPPTAAEEAAASLQHETRVCKSCKAPKPFSEFRLIGNGQRALQCTECHGKKIQAGMKNKAARMAVVTALKGEASAQPVIADRVFERVSADLQADLDADARDAAEIQRLEQARLARADSIAERQRFLDDYKKYAQEEG